MPSGGTTWEAGNRQEVSRLVTVPVSADAGKKNKKTFAAFDSVADVHVEGNQVTPRRVCPLAVTMGFVFLCFHGRVDVGASLHFPSSFTENIGLKKSPGDFVKKCHQVHTTILLLEDEQATLMSLLTCLTGDTLLW